MGIDLNRQVHSRLTQLAAGRLSRGEVADWALGVMKHEDAQVVEPQVWRVLDQLAGADLLQGPDEYLHGREDFASWLAEFEAESRR